MIPAECVNNERKRAQPLLTAAEYKVHCDREAELKALADEQAKAEGEEFEDFDE